MRLPNTTLTLVLFTILGAPCLAFETWVYAQSPQPTPAPTLKVYARETIVDVTVTDSKGNPVHGLTQSDFTIKEDNKPQPIRSFEEFGTQTAKILPKLPPGVYTNLQPPPSSSAVNILLLDGLNTAPTDATDPDQVGQSFAIQDRVKQGAAKFLKSMPPGTQAAVLDLSRGLRILENVSSDPELLSASVSTMDMNMDGRAATIPQWCAQQDTRNRMTLEALRQIAADTTSIKGKKNLIWFSAGMPSITDSTVNSQGGTGGSVMSVHGCLPDYTSDLLKTYGLLAAAQVVIYPVGARIMGSDIFSPIGPGPPIPPDTPITYPQYVAEEQLSLESVAEATGGTAYYNTNDLAAAAAQAVAKAASYYTISYVPPGQKYNWAHHAIKVTVDVPDAHLIYRQTYDAVDPNTLRPAPGLSLASDFAETNPANSHPDPEVTMRLAMGRAMPTSQQLLFDVQVEPSTAPAKPTDPPVFGMLDPKLKDKPLTRYSFVYALPARQITFTESPDNTRHASLEFDLAAYDSDGKLINSLGQTLKVPLTTDQYQQLMKGPFRFFQQLDLPSGQLFLRIGILDPTSAKIGTLEIPLTVPKK
jgi:VWFA-related protein